ncbi:MAG: HD domain-containing protein [Candidatus Sungbacteria bacterium]|nr:HD domain-containing protein [Candidatus Sungbacteria bacterium]
MKKETNEKLNIPKEVAQVMAGLERVGFEAYAVGGCVRDVLLGQKPEDWDVTTKAAPKEIQQAFPKSFYANKFFTVTVKTEAEDPTLNEIEITTFRLEGRYEDKRHPVDVKPAQTLEEDLSRRDFTVNAIALGADGTLTDPHGGKEDIAKKIIRTVGKPEERFSEDALRMLRAVRFAGKLDFAIEPKTLAAIKENAGWIQAVSKERIRDEFIKIVNGPNPKQTLELLYTVGLMKYILPELEEGIGIEQRGPHKYEVWEHNLRALDYAAGERWTTRVRIAALLHDVGKPRTRERRNDIWTFYGHDVVGAKMAFAILKRLKFPREEIEAIAKLVRWHLFNYKLKRDDQYERDIKALGEEPKDIEDSEADVQETTDSAIRRLIRNVGADLIHDLIKVRVCDRIATGVPKAVPYRLRHFQFRVEKVFREHEAITVSMLNIRGEDVMNLLGIDPGPKVGHILNALLEEALDDPQKNNKDYLERRAKELGELSDEDLKRLREKAEEKVEILESEREREIKKKYRVK